MSGDAVPLILGALLSVAALAFVIQPLFAPSRRPPPAPRPPAGARDDSAIRALREIEFDRATGKLSDADYAELRRSYAALAVQELRVAAARPAPAPPAVAPSDADPIERRVRAFREEHRQCRTCGIRPEADALYCSTCGALVAHH